MNFLIDNQHQYTYDELLAVIRQDTAFCPCLQTSDLFAFFCNIVKALAHGRDLVLLDADIHAYEIEGVAQEEVNKKYPLPTILPATFEALVEAVMQSSSRITIFTSGTTGQPKKVVHNIATLTRSVRRGDKYIGQVWGYAYNPTHMAGLQVFFQAFANQNTLINIFNASRADVYAALDKYHITHFSATPTFYRLLMPFEKEFPQVQRITLGGEKSDQALYDAIHRIFPQAKINNVYASTEAGTLFAAKGDAFQIPSAIQEKVRVVENELLLHKSLLGESDSFQLENDYYHTGDLIEWIDKVQGLFRFVSRKNELINVGGYKVNPGEVEAAMMTMDGVKQAIVYGKANSILGNVLCAEVQLEEGAILTELNIRSILKSQLQDYKIPRRIKFVEQLALTRTGKVKRL